MLKTILAWIGGAVVIRLCLRGIASIAEDSYRPVQDERN